MRAMKHMNEGGVCQCSAVTLTTLAKQQKCELCAHTVLGGSQARNAMKKWAIKYKHRRL